MATSPPDDAFYAQLGKALDAWATLELVLSWWFAYLTGMHEAMARAIFYSANSYSTKRDMLRLALDTARSSWRPPAIPTKPYVPLLAAPKDMTDFLSLAFKVAGQYSTARNSVAHRMTVFHEETNGYIMVDRGRWWSESGLTRDHLLEMEDNITRLKDILRDVHICLVSPEKALPQMPLAEGLRQVQSLPNQAHSLITNQS